MSNSLWPHEGPQDFSAHGIFQAKNTKWVAISFSRRSFPPMGQTHVFCTGSLTLQHWATREASICKLKRKEKKQIQVYLYFLRPWRLRILEQITMGEWERAMGNVKQSEKEWGRVTLSMAMLAISWFCSHFKVKLEVTPCRCYYKQCYDEHWGTCVSFNSGFLGVGLLGHKAVLFPVF